MIERVDAGRRQHSRGLETGEIAEVLAVRGFRWHEPPMNRLRRATEIAEGPDSSVSERPPPLIAYITL